MNRILALAFVVAPSLLPGQVSGNTVRGALVKKTLSSEAIVAGEHTVLSTAPTFQGMSCEGRCIVARGDNKQNVHVVIRALDPTVKLEEVRTSLIVPHGSPHSVRLTLDEAQIVGLLCNGKDAMLASPRFRAMGAAKPGFKWGIFEGAKLVKEGHSDGESLKWDGDGKSMGPMQLALFSDGTVEITHGSQRVVMTSDDSALIQQKSGSSLQYQDISIWAADVPEIAILSAQIQGVNR